MKEQEYVLLLNEKGEFIGTREKYDVHTTPPSTWLFPAGSSIVKVMF